MADSPALNEKSRNVLVQLPPDELPPGPIEVTGPGPIEPGTAPREGDERQRAGFCEVERCWRGGGGGRRREGEQGADQEVAGYSRGHLA